MRLFFSLVSGWTAAEASPSIPGLDSLAEKGGVWVLTSILVWWILGKLSGQIERLITSVDKLAERIGGHE